MYKRQSKEAVAKLVAPLKQHLETYQQRLSESEKSRNTQLGALREQLDALSENSRTLSSETEQLRMILNSSQARGRWGEETLRRVVEAAGLSSHCDFSEQTGAAEGRPDMIVHLPEGRHIVVDAKSPDLSFLNDLESGDAAQRKSAIEQHGKKMRETIKALMATIADDVNADSGEGKKETAPEGSEEILMKLKALDAARVIEYYYAQNDEKEKDKPELVLVFALLSDFAQCLLLNLAARFAARLASGFGAALAGLCSVVVHHRCTALRLGDAIALDLALVVVVPAA